MRYVSFASSYSAYGFFTVIFFFVQFRDALVPKKDQIVGIAEEDLIVRVIDGSDQSICAVRFSAKRRGSELMEAFRVVDGLVVVQALE